MRMHHTLVAAAMVLAAGVAGQSQARDKAPNREASSEQLTVANVDFRDGTQVKQFYTRLQQAAMFVCGVSLEADSVRRSVDRECAEKALREAVSSLDRPLLTATYQQAGAPMLARGY